VTHKVFPNILPYKVGEPAVFGLAGWSGRSLTNNTPDVILSLAANTAIALGIGKDPVTARPCPTFPYVPLIH
jgi:hypothetical protein